MGRYAEAETLTRRALEALERTLGPDHPDTLVALNNLAVQKEKLGQYAEAEPYYRRACEALKAKQGAEHADTLLCQNNLAVMLNKQGRRADAEAIYRTILEVAERTLGKDHPNTLTTVNNLAALYDNQGHYSQAEPLYLRTLTTRERVLGPSHPDTLASANNLAALYVAQGRYTEAEKLHIRALEAQERAAGPEHPITLTFLNNLAMLYHRQGRYTKAEPLFRRGLETAERVLGREHQSTLIFANNLAMLENDLGHHTQAEPLFRRVLEAMERTLGKEHPQTLTAVANLAALYQRQARYMEAEVLMHRVREATVRTLGAEHPDTLTAISNLALLLDMEERAAEAEQLYRSVLEARERVLGKDHPDTLITLNNLATLYSNQGRYAEATPLYLRGLKASERRRGKEHPSTLASLHNVAAMYMAQGRYALAQSLYLRTVAAKQKALGKDHPNTLMSINNLAMLHFNQRNWSRAAKLWRFSTTAISRRTQLAEQSSLFTDGSKSEIDLSSAHFKGLIKAIYRLPPRTTGTDPAGSRETFLTAQWSLNSEAARSVTQMAARSVKGEGQLAMLVRERQDLVAEWQKLDAWRIAALGLEASKRDAKAEAENSARLAQIDTRLAEIDKLLATQFKNYAALVNPSPLSVADVQAQLHADEALVLFLDTGSIKPTPEETFIWVVTKTNVRWVRSSPGVTALTREVQALRCGLDLTAAMEPNCAKLTGKAYTEEDAQHGKPLFFDHARAHKLYSALFGQIEDAIKDKHLLIVPSGPLTQLPFQVLVTAPPTGSAHKSAAWLVRKHAVTILPAVSSLQALRRLAHASGAKKQMIGFGNPLLDGNMSDARYAKYYQARAQLARDNQQCQRTPSRQVVATAVGRRGIVVPQNLANLSHIRMQDPLPETAFELCAVARALNANETDLRLGASASEHEVKTLNAGGQLANYRIVHFATHGALAGELRGTTEPGLILTPPETPSEDDDGYLSASEIAELKLDADWVILSACNTAAGDAVGGQALSGLARAFIYAQARALLVSHWAVDSNATVKLITTAMRAMASNRRMGRAEAVRRAMLSLIDKGDPREAHPAHWAPFIVVGEGAR